PMKTLQEIGNVSDEEAYKTWNMGIGMVLVTPDVDKTIEIAEKHGIKAQQIGTITKAPGIHVGSMKF
ncbi:phosphoribosylformylglycinamidine cyclo-ligase, partial [Candidatus Peregrinibacteria bacterium]|nr:phosphoribosylformylglycinamidine cyclo-ligase [Candidatus Peregrinibacteria bacterium]